MLTLHKKIENSNTNFTLHRPSARSTSRMTSALSRRLVTDQHEDVSLMDRLWESCEQIDEEALFFRCLTMVGPWLCCASVVYIYVEIGRDASSASFSIYVLFAVAIYMMGCCLVWKYGQSSYQKCIDSSQSRQAQLDSVMSTNNLHSHFGYGLDSQVRAERRKVFALHLAGQDAIWGAPAIPSLDVLHLITYLCFLCALCLALPLFLRASFITPGLDWEAKLTYMTMVVVIIAY